MAQAEFHIFDGGLFEDLQLTLVTIVSAERNFSTSHAHGQILSALLSSVDGKSGTFCKVGSRHASLRRPTSVGRVERSHFGWRSVWSAPGGSRSFLLWRTQSLCVTENYKPERTNPTRGYWKIPFRITAEVAIIDIVLAEKKKYVFETLWTFWLNMQLLSALGNFEFQLIMCQSSPKLYCFCSPLSWHVSGGSRQYYPAKKLRTATVHYTLCIKGWTVTVWQVAGEDVEHLSATEGVCLNPWVAFYS